MMYSFHKVANTWTMHVFLVIHQELKMA